MVKELKPAQGLTPIDEVAAAWGVEQNTVKNWCEFVYQAFEVILPSSGPFPEWGVQMLGIAAKHVSVKANLYFAETGEKRRLRGAEFVKKIRTLRSAGHFAEFDQFRKFQNFQNLPDAQTIDDELLAELGQISREADEQISTARAAIAQHEQAQIEEFAQFVEASPHRKKNLLIGRLRAGKALRDATEESTADVGEAIDVAYRQLPG